MHFVHTLGILGTRQSGPNSIPYFSVWFSLRLFEQERRTEENNNGPRAVLFLIFFSPTFVIFVEQRRKQLLLLLLLSSVGRFIVWRQWKNKKRKISVCCGIWFNNCFNWLSFSILFPFIFELVEQSDCWLFFISCLYRVRDIGRMVQ